MIILDTHIWIWWINNDHQSLGVVRQEQIMSAEVIAVSAISCFEVAWLARHQRMTLPCQTLEWVEKALSPSGISLLPITPAIATRAVDLQEHHSDPQDRIIIASAIEHNAQLMSNDSKFHLYLEMEERLL